MRHSIRLIVLAGMLVLNAVLIYLPGLSGPLLFDDKPALTGNQLAKIDGRTFDEWRTAAFSSNSGPLRRPIAMLSFAANHALSGDFSPFGLKAVNLAIHLLISGVLYFLFRGVLKALAIGGDEPSRNLIALLGAAIWLLHPLHVSTVLYAVQRMAQLAALFVAAGLLLFTYYRTRWAACGASPGEVLAVALWLLLLAVLAALSKENGALLPWLVIVLEVCVFRGLWNGRPNRRLRQAGWLLLVLPLVLVSLVLVFSPDTLIRGYAGREFTLEQRVLTQGRLLWRYLGWLSLPDINDMGFQHDDIPLSFGLLQPLTTLLALLAWLLALCFAFLARRRYPLLLLGVLFYLVGHSLESGIYPLEMVYEHRNYLPDMMICLALAAALLIPTAKYKHVSVWYPTLGVLAILSLLLFIRVQTWSDELTLSRVNVAQHPESARSNFFYGNALLRRYERRKALGLSEQESSESLLLARLYFERMYQANDQEVGALVTLFYLDSQFFPELQQQVNWLEKLQALLPTKVMQASDWNALGTLIECFELGTCKADRAQVTTLLDGLSDRYPGSIQVLQYRYRYLVSIETPSSEWLPLLQQAQVLAPTQPWIYSYLLTEYAREQDVARMYEYARRWLLNDRSRYSLPLLKGMFIEPAINTGSSND